MIYLIWWSIKEKKEEETNPLPPKNNTHGGQQAFKYFDKFYSIKWGGLTNACLVMLEKNEISKKKEIIWSM